MKEKVKTSLISLIFIILAYPLFAQRINRFSTNEMELIYFGKRYSYLMPHVAGTFHNALDFHKKHWDYPHKKTFVLLTDFEDNGHGGAIVMPVNMVILGISPFNYAFSIIPSSERFQWLSSHELTHITLADKANKKDMFWRKAFAGKVRRDEKTPITALWSYFTTPRWYAPRWFHEGIACYLETWMSGGLGRALGSYDEMYFRSIVNEQEPLYSVIGLETEGTTIDFQVGANAYLYGTRFVNYLSATYGEDQLIALYKRTDDSKAFYASQFKKVYGQPVKKIWREWMDFEQQFQQQNLSAIREFSITPFTPITAEPLGSLSNYVFDVKKNKLFAAMNRPGEISQIIELDVSDGSIRKIATLDAPVLYNVTFLAYDASGEQLFISEQNSKFRSLVSVDVKSGKKQTKIRYARTGNLVFNPADRVLWAVKHDNGYATLVKIPEPYTELVPMYTTEFGKSIFDLAISNDGKKLSASLTGISGEQSLILFDLSELEAGSKNYETVYELDDNTLTQFQFSSDDKYLIGTSYYTGVSNIWSIRLSDKNFDLLSNDETGLFMPFQISKDSLMVFKFQRNGMQPGIIPLEVLHEANAIEYLGNLCIDKNPELENYSLEGASKVNINKLKTDESAYYPIKNMALSGAFPDIAGFKNTVSLGYRLNWRDRTGLSDISVFIGGSPWSAYDNDQKFHFSLHASYWTWFVHADWNKTDFYDLFGPTKRSRAGYSISLGQKKQFTLQSPYKWNYSFSISHFGDLEVLPQFQNVSSPLRNFQTISGELGISKLRRTLGGVMDEKGYLWNLTTYSYLAKGNLYPSLISEQAIGFLIPGIRNSSLWLRNSLGQSFGKKGSNFSSFFFGGFRNNYIDWQAPEQYRKVMAFPGADIDEIRAHNFIKTMGEINLKPLRLRNFGTTWLYPTYLKSAFFGTHLLVNPDQANQSRNLFNAGLQLDLEVVLFSYLKTTWSAGFAQSYEQSEIPKNQWMFSLKLLGN